MSPNNTFPRGTELLVIVVENSNPNGDPDQESDPRRRSHDNRGMITGVSFKRKLRDLVLRKDERVWPVISEKLSIQSHKLDALRGKGNAAKVEVGKHGDLHFDILESREHERPRVRALLESDFHAFQMRFWDGRLFGNTFLEEGGPDTVRAGIAHFALGVSISPVRVHRLTKTKMAPAEGGREGEAGPTRGMAPLAHRVVEHGVYAMPFFVNPTGAQGRRSTGCAPVDLNLLFRLIKYAYPHTKSDIRPLVEVKHAWYAEHNDSDGLGSFSEFDFIDALSPTRKGNAEEPSRGHPAKLADQYQIPTELPDDLRGKLSNDKLYDLCVELPGWCNASS